jgi:hypothetical protein
MAYSKAKLIIIIIIIIIITNVKEQMSQRGTRDRGTINIKTIAATMYSPGTWFVSGICVDTLHKGDNDNNNNNIMLGVLFHCVFLCIVCV